MDFNHDGKRDLKDDMLFQSIIDSADNKKQSRTPQTHKNAGGTKSILSIAIPLLYLGLWLPGDIPINMFTGIIALICFGFLGCKLLLRIFR